MSNTEDESTDAGNWGGAIRSSDEVAVIAMERRGCVRLLIFYPTEHSSGRDSEEGKAGKLWFSSMPNGSGVN